MLHTIYEFFFLILKNLLKRYLVFVSWKLLGVFLFFLQKLTAQSVKFKECALKEDTSTNKCTKKQLNDDVFKKPLLPKKNIRKFPKPEKLSHWYDNQCDFGT